MKLQNTQAFTLIELLVVVLIIGILAAVALPQYQKAVKKARFAEAFANLKTIAQADAVCYLNKGRHCGLSELDIDIGETIQHHTGIPMQKTKHFFTLVVEMA